MQRQKAVITSILAFFLASPLACGPKCPEAKSAMSETEMVKDDATRINGFVERRKSLVAGDDDGGYDTFELQRVKFSVTAYELAIQIQLRIIKLAESSELYEKNIDTIMKTRCFLDEILKANLINKDSKVLSDRQGKDIQEKHVLFKKLFGKNGEPSKYELKDCYESGIEIQEEEGEGEDFAEDEEGDDDDKMFDGEAQADDEEDEDEEEEEGESDDVDVFN